MAWGARVGGGRLGPRCAIAVNGQYAEGEVQLAEGDEVAVLPPMSGG